MSGEIDEITKTGSRTRLLRFAPGVYTTAPFVHEYWEEVFLVSGDLTVGNDQNGEGGTPFQPFTYACRPPGAYHGPFASDGGCVLLEMHYYDPACRYRFTRCVVGALMLVLGPSTALGQFGHLPAVFDLASER